MKIKFNSDDELPLNKTIEISTTTIVVRGFFYDNKKILSHLFLDECLYKIQNWRVKMNLKKLIPNIVRVIILIILLKI